MKLGMMAVAFVSVFGMGGFAAAQGPDIGKGLYDEFCMTCHGASAKGGGEIADILTIKMPDLTALAARNDGKFPMLEVIHVIDGRTGLRAHGGPMPLFGNMFSSQSADQGLGYGSVIETRGRVLSLAMYLESLQQ